jgi:hypothetical protein
MQERCGRSWGSAPRKSESQQRYPCLLLLQNEKGLFRWFMCAVLLSGGVLPKRSGFLNLLSLQAACAGFIGSCLLQVHGA